ncbi:MAG: hypothetical protein V1809_03895 [Planctomycetota bacterium]
MSLSGGQKRKMKGRLEHWEKREHHRSWIREHPEAIWDYMDRPPAVCLEIPVVSAADKTAALTFPATGRRYSIRRELRRAAVWFSIQLKRIWDGIFKRGLSAGHID